MKMGFCTLWAFSYCMLFTHKTDQHDPRSKHIDNVSHDENGRSSKLGVIGLRIKL